MDHMKQEDWQMDPLFMPFSQPNGLPRESKLVQYMSLSSSPDANHVVTKSLAALGLEPDRRKKGPVESEDALVGLSHSSSSPNFLASYASPTQDGSPGPLLSPQHSPTLRRRSPGPPAPTGPLLPGQPPPTLPDGMPPPQMTYQENVGGTTYFFPASVEEGGVVPEANGAAPGPSGVRDRLMGIPPTYHAYPGATSHVANMKPKANAPGFFMSDELRLDILHRQSLTLAQADRDTFPDLPNEVDNYHELCPMDGLPTMPVTKSSFFGYVTSVYKATHAKTGERYCMYRVNNYRLSNTKCMLLVDMWKKIQHSNLVHLREVFTTKAFEDHSIVFVYDYHPGAETIMARHFHRQPNGPSDLQTSRPFSQSKSGPGGPRQHAGLLPESLIWNYVVQLTSALRTIHAAGLACRTLDPSKILLTGKSRLHINCCCMVDVLNYDSSQAPLHLVQHYQQEDLMSLGRLVMALACNSLLGISSRENLQASMDIVARNYSADLRNLIVYLLTNSRVPRSVNDIMPMIGARFYTQLDAAHMRADVTEAELAKELQNGRLFRLLLKLGTINERPELNMEPSWAETGDRYMLKLFRDYLFHQVTDDGRPWLDTSHVVNCLNKLDAASPDKVCLMSHDEQNVLVVSYAELKHCLEVSYNEIMAAAAAVPKGPS